MAPFSEVAMKVDRALQYIRTNRESLEKLYISLVVYLEAPATLRKGWMMIFDKNV
jgi:hypothetical protein